MGRGNDTLRGLARSFRMMDDAGDGKLDRADLKWGLKDYGVELLDDQIEALIDHFDTNGDGFISFGEFLRGLRGELNDARKAVVNAAYDVLDSTHDGRVTFADIKRTYSAADHPMVESGRKTEEEVLKEFMGMWDTQDHVREEEERDTREKRHTEFGDCLLRKSDENPECAVLFVHVSLSLSYSLSLSFPSLSLLLSLVICVLLSLSPFSPP